MIVTTNLAPAEWPTVCGDAKMTTAPLDGLTDPSDSALTGHASWRLQNRA